MDRVNKLRRRQEREMKMYLMFFMMFLPVACAGEPFAQDLFEREDFPELQSSWISGATYYREKGTDNGMLVVRIKGKKISYLDVPADLWQEFRRAASPGSFYGKRIKGRFERIEGDPLSMRYDAERAVAEEARVEIAFNEDCEALILRTIGEALESIRVAAYAFTRSRIAAALVEAQRRGVDVQIKMDARQAEYPLAARVIDYLRRRGIPVTLIVTAGDYAAMHNKFMVIDDRTVLTGSFNYTTTAALASWENTLRVDSKEIATRYRNYWNAIFSD